MHEDHHLLAVAQCGECLVIGDLEHTVLALLRVRGRDADEGLREWHGAVSGSEVEEAGLRVDAQEERDVEVVGQRGREPDL
eukprot:scaffold55853_cov54-Phaeocystis_antarctica.AAC.1